MIEHVAAVKDEGGFAHAVIDALVIKAGKLIPLCDDAQRVRAGTCLHMDHTQSAGSKCSRDVMQTGYVVTYSLVVHAGKIVPLYDDAQRMRANTCLDMVHFDSAGGDTVILLHFVYFLC